ncbi:hypothetical protein [Alteromonas abrolhosensis]|uniref:hypothetical protein n=1 Tax=Alteromonas abrolhosensis TaxID=1892904 RepID=UPI00096BB868|nr:hypothetical protein [Alteromonas abrolhosensis]|tara:strand:- start:707 stop:2707 length:2001 start_codon:yes stop_codon:yes gene_type:complete
MLNVKRRKFFNQFSTFDEQKKPKFDTQTVRLLDEYLEFVSNVAFIEKDRLSEEFTDENGKSICVDLIEDSGPVFHRLFTNIKQFPIIEKRVEYLKTTNGFLRQAQVPLHLKVQLLAFECSSLDTSLQTYFKEPDEGVKSLELRLAIIAECFKSRIKHSCIPANLVGAIHDRLLSLYQNTLTLRGQLIQCLNFLDKRLKSSEISIEKQSLIKHFIGYATSYHLLSKNELLERLDEFRDCLADEEVEFLRLDIEAEVNSTVYAFKMSSGNLSHSTTRDKNIVTLIRFSLPFKSTYEQPVTIDNDEGKPLINVSPVRTFWEDPMFEVFMDLKVVNINWSYFSDLTIDHEGRCCHVTIKIDGLFTPDVELSESTHEAIDFSEKEQIEGKKYYPHKEFALKTMLEAYDVLSSAISLGSKKDLSANMFSNYLVQYVDNDTRTTLCSKLYALTCHDSFDRVRSKFVDKLSSINLNDSYIGVRELLYETKIESARNLKEFVHRSIELIVKNNIEFDGGYSFLWEDVSTTEKKPKTEPQMQPYIFALLKTIYEFVGIQISRETVCANGQIDFLVTFTNSKKVALQTCVELKLAHATKVEDGITKQLPKYMRSLRTKQGVFIALWFKSFSPPYVFDKPANIETSNDLEEKLARINPDKNISVIVIDCSKPTPPSKI